MARLVIKSAWTIATIGGRQIPLEDLAIVVEHGRIADLTRDPPADAETISLTHGIAVPGFINLHNHAINAPLFRGIVDDLPRSAIGESKVYSMLMPMGGLAASFLDEDELRAIMALGVLEVMHSGVTTLVDQFRPPQASIFGTARQWGLRLYGAPYLFSPAAGTADASVAGASRGSLEGETGLAEFERLFRAHDDGPQGLVRVILGPHAADSCAPDLLRKVEAISREREILVTIHLAQSQGEVDRVMRQRGLGCAAYVHSVRLLREGVILAHGTHLTDDELQQVRDTGAAIANCASVFLRGGKAPNFERFRHAGVRFGIGTDAERMDFFAQLRATGFASKQAYGAGDAATAADLLRAATMGAADILRRPDLGRIEKGATADLLVIDALKPHLQPIHDPIRSLVWYATAADIDTVLIGGRAVIRGGKTVGIDEASVIAEGAAATRRVWAESRARGYFPVEADPRKP